MQFVRRLGFVQCRLSLAIPKEETYTGVPYFHNKKIATSYPNILRAYLGEQKVNAQVEEIGGSVEIAPSIGLAQGVFDIVDTGSTLLMKGLKEVDVVMISEALFICNESLSANKQARLDLLLFRIKSVKDAGCNKYILLNAPNENAERIIAKLQGMKSPRVLPLAIPEWSSIHTVIKENTFWDVISELNELDAEGILVLVIEKMVL